MLLAGCIVALSAFSTFASAKPNITWVDCHQNVPVAFTQSFPDVNTTNLPRTLRCGEIKVPLDYGQPGGPDNTITLGLAMYRPHNPKGVIFL